MILHADGIATIVPQDVEAERGYVGSLLYRRSLRRLDPALHILHPLRRELAVVLDFLRSHDWTRPRSHDVPDIESARTVNEAVALAAIAQLDLWDVSEARHELTVECAAVAAGGVYRMAYWLSRLQAAHERRRKLELAERLLREVAR